MENVMENMSGAFGILYDAAMELERAQFPGAVRYVRNENLADHAIGFKEKNIKFRVGEIALKLALAENKSCFITAYA